MDKLLVLVLSVTYVQSICALSSGSRNQLNKFISHYEGLSYDRNDLKNKHLRVRRSPDPHEQLHLNFHSHGKYFPLRLKRDRSIFSAEFSVPEGDHTFHPSNIYEGWIEGQHGSMVHGFLHDEIFEGRIRMPCGREFLIEPAWKYFNESQFHSVIYDVDNLRYPYPHGGGCGMRKNLRDWMRKVQTSHVAEEEKKDDKAREEVHEQEPESIRIRRATSSPKTSCRLFVQADWKFVDLFAKSKTRSLYLMTQYVKSVADIYKGTSFTGYAHSVELAISRMKADTHAECQASNCKFLDPNIGVAKFLELNSETNHDDHCLAYVFTYRDFADGVLGLAWIGEASGASGGVCERWKTYAGGKSKSLNTGVVTTLNYGSDVPMKVTEITLAHEIGHNFGSQHDPVSGSTCSPGSSGGGNYIMYPKATSGSETNNYKFSTCSRSQIGLVLNAKSDICFEPASGPICGNRIVEDGEECDCGYGEECNVDICCVKQVSGGSNNCKYSSTAMAVTNNTRCSPSQGPCCQGSTCTIKPRDSMICSNITECALQAKCDGTTASCPTPPPKPDIVTDCQNSMKVCLNGTCTGSICLKSNQTDCMCNTKETYCDLCCMSKNDTSTCKSLDHTKKKAPGSPCDNYLGYCDIFSKCRKVDAEGPLSKLKNFIFNKETFNSIYTWMKEKWWACCLIGLGLILFMAGFIKCCSVHTPSSNPNLPQARPMTLPRTISRRRQRPNPASNAHPSAPGIAPYEEPLPSYDTAVRQGHGRGRPQGQGSHPMNAKR